MLVGENFKHRLILTYSFLLLLFSTAVILFCHFTVTLNPPGIQLYLIKVAQFSL